MFYCFYVFFVFSIFLPDELMNSLKINSKTGKIRKAVNTSQEIFRWRIIKRIEDIINKTATA